MVIDKDSEVVSKTVRTKRLLSVNYHIAKRERDVAVSNLGVGRNLANEYWRGFSCTHLFFLLLYTIHIFYLFIDFLLAII